MTEAVNNNQNDYYLPDNQTPTQTQSLADPEAFLKILVAQLKYQNPLEPQDSSEFVAQLTQMASMEQMFNVANSMDKMSSQYELARYFDLIGQQVLLGKEDEVVTGVVGGVVIYNGEPSFYLLGDPDGQQYTLDQLLSVTDSADYNILNYSSLIGHNVVIQDDSSEVTGTVEKIAIQDGGIAVWVNGEAYGIGLIKEVHGVAGEPGTELPEDE